MDTTLPPGIGPDGWIYEGFDYPEDLMGDDRIFQPCSKSHPAGITHCRIPCENEWLLKQCTFYEPDHDDDPEGKTIACMSWTSLGSTAVCNIHLDIESYLRKHNNDFNQSQKCVLALYEKGKFAHITCKADMEKAGDGILASIIHELSNSEGCHDTQEAQRRLATIARQIQKLSLDFQSHNARNPHPTP